MAAINESQSERLNRRTVEAQAGEGDRWQLLPGIPDEITQDEIGPKLPWTTFHSLSSVNRGWRQATQGHEFYDARVRSQSTQTLIVLGLGDEQSEGFSVIALYSVNDNSCHLLPPIPGTGPQFGIQWLGGECISLDGKVYVLGGFRRHSLNKSDAPTTSEVYVMDLARQGQWKQCASMQDPRQWFGCGVMNGKIYVFGGVSDNWPVCGSEVYDPTKDAWSPIAPMASFRCYQKVTAVGEELFVHNGRYIHSQHVYGSDTLEWGEWERSDWIDLHVSLGKGNQIEGYRDIHNALFAEVYRPLKDEWRVMKNFIEDFDIDDTGMLTVEGKLHRISQLGLDFYDSDSNSWIPSQSLSIDIPTPNDLTEVFASFWDNSILLEDKIITLVDVDVCIVETGDASESYIALMRSDKLLDENEEIVMRELPIRRSLPPGYVLRTLFPCTIQL